MAKLPKIGFLGAATPSAWRQRVSAFVERLRKLGWVEGRTVAIEYRWAEGRSERNAQIATELVRLQVDVIITTGSAAYAVKHATTVIPVVFALAGDPVATGLVESLARPGGNLTGLSSQVPDLAGKRVELLREVVPTLRRLAVLVDVALPGADFEVDEVRTAARLLGSEVIPLEVRQTEDIVPAFDGLKDRADALYVGIGPLATANRIRISTLAHGARLPTMHTSEEDVQAGGLMSYGANRLDQFRRSADYVDKILHGQKPFDIPVEQPTRFELVVNAITAKAIGLKVPEAFLVRADRVIE